MKRKAEMIKQMTDREIRQQLLLSQTIFLCIAIVLSLFFFPHIQKWFQLFQLNGQEILIFGVVPASLLVFFEIVLYYIVPDEWLDDGGINEKVFKNQSILSIFVIALVVSISEEALFRGVLQTTFGLFFASVIFILLHVRYLTKPLLLVMISVTSFLIGFLFYMTENLLVVITFHFLVDFLLGLFIKFKK